MKINFDVTAQELGIVQHVLKAALPASCRVWVFGSRAKHQAKHNSDLDLAIECADKLDKSTLMQLETGFDESLLPYSVDIVDMNAVEPYFKEIIDKQKVLFPMPRRVPELRFTEFDGEWEEKMLGEVLTIGSGKDYKHLKHGDVPVYGSGGYMLSVNEYLYEGESVCIGRKGNIDAPMFLSGKFWTVDTLFFTHKFKDVTPKHVYSIFLNINWKKYNEAGGVPSLSKSTIEKIKVFISPSIAEQQKIAAFLSAVDDKLANLRRKCELLENYKRGLMQQLFSQQVRFKQDDGSDFPDWKVKTLSELLTLNLRGIDKPKSNYMAIGIRSHMKGTFQKPESEPDKIAMEKLYVVREGDLIVNITFAWEGAIAIARPEDDGGLVSHRFPTYIFKENKLLRDFFRHIISQPQFKFKLDMISPGGAGRNRVMNKRDFLKIDWKIPSIQEQQKIANFLQSIDNKIDAVAKQITQLDTFKKGLLQKLFV